MLRILGLEFLNLKLFNNYSPVSHMFNVTKQCFIPAFSVGTDTLDSVIFSTGSMDFVTNLDCAVDESVNLADFVEKEFTFKTRRDGSSELEYFVATKHRKTKRHYKIRHLYMNYT